MFKTLEKFKKKNVKTRFLIGGLKKVHKRLLQLRLTDTRGGL